jgi:hypothetical protein
MLSSDVVKYVGKSEIIEVTLPPPRQKQLNMEDDNNTSILNHLDHSIMT